MGSAANSRVIKSIIPEDIQKNFDESDIEKTWMYLERTFKVNVKEWKKVYEEEYRYKGTTRIEFFVRFLRNKFEHPICQLTYRDPQNTHAWLHIIRYIVKIKYEPIRIL